MIDELKMTNINIIFKSLSKNDLPLLFSWFKKPHIKKWYAQGEDFSLEMIEEKYTPRINNQKIPNFIVYIDNTPIGYIQLYHLTDFLPEGVTNYNHQLFNDYKPSELAGIDFFIAEEHYLNKGYASKTLGHFIKAHARNNFKAIIVDPLKENKKAILFFERNGFISCDDNENSDYELMLLDISRE